jgi:hypothetical protein
MPEFDAPEGRKKRDSSEARLMGNDHRRAAEKNARGDQGENLTYSSGSTMSTLSR